MGWCSGTEIFDVAVGILLERKKADKEIIKALAEILEEHDWDCQCDSTYWDEPLVQEVFRELHPKWFEED